MNAETERHDEHPVDALLTSVLRDEAPVDVQQRLAQQVDRFTPPAHRLRFPITVGSAIAATVVVALLLLFRGQQPLYAQVRAAMAEARTIHAVGRRLVDGQWVTDAEFWFDRDRGMRMRDGDALVVVDDGTHRWTWRAAAGTVTKVHSLDPREGADLDDLLAPIVKDTQRDPSHDRTVDGETWRAYIVTDPAGRYRNRAWLDDKHRLRRMQEQVKAGDRWVDDELAEVVYDQPIDAAVFEPDFPADARLIDRTAVGDPYPLASALLVREEMGLIFAVHAVTPVGDDMALVVSSVRPTDETRIAAPPRQRIEGQMGYGSMNLYGGGHRDAEHNWLGASAMDLATFEDDALQVDVSLFKLSGPWPARPAAWPARLYLRADGVWYAQREERGQDVSMRIDMDVPVAGEAITLDEALRRVYERATELNGPIARVRLTLRSEPFTPEEIAAEVARGVPESEAKRYQHERSAEPTQITLDAFRDEVAARMELYHWLR